jgi:oligogalacturonide lyase
MNKTRNFYRRAACCSMALVYILSTSFAQDKVWKFNFDADHALAGYLAVTPATSYTPEKGYGFDLGTTDKAGQPFYFSVRLPEGNYNVIATLGDAKEGSVTTIKAENRRLMEEKIVTAPGQFISKEFTVHIRDSINHSTGVPVRLKSREYAYLHWDDKLTLEFGNSAPRLSKLEISPAGHPLTVFLAGNSTVVDQAEEPWAAWGQMIPAWFRPEKIVIANYAESGETLKAFVNERRLAKIWSIARPGDYLFIEFAHNDQKEGPNHLDPFTTYKEEIGGYVGEARKRRMIPVLVTSMHRRNFDSLGHVVNTLGDYPEAMRQAAAALGTALIDLNAMSRTLYEAWGPERSVHAFVHYPAHSFPGQDKELKDDTHFNSYGAYELAKCVVKGIQEHIPELSKYLLAGIPVFDPAHPDPLESFDLPKSPKIDVRRPDGDVNQSVSQSPASARNADTLSTLETGGTRPMPDEWIDSSTHHKIVRLTRIEGNSLSFYFHNNPFVGNRMVFYNTEHGSKQIYTVDLKTFDVQPVTGPAGSINGEIVGRKSRSVYYQVKDSVFSTDIDTRKTRLIFVFPPDFRGGVTTLNADETLLAGAQSGDEAKEILKKYPDKSQYFDRIYDAHISHTLFTIDTRTAELKKIHQENTWLGHVQFSPTDPSLLMFCHEGPWHKVDRIWTIDLRSGVTKLMHKRTMENEIAGHEFFSPDGQRIFFDWQLPKGQTFFLGNVDLRTGVEKKYQMTRDEWSIHFSVSPDQRLFAGDGGDAGQVAHAQDGRWIYLFRPEGDHFVSERLVNMKYQNYKLEPNIHFSPDGQWIIFRANFEGREEVYAVQIKKI